MRSRTTIAAIICAIALGAAFVTPSARAELTGDASIQHPGMPAATESVAPATTAPLRIMVLGDSVAHGYRGDITWRYRLFQHLSAQAVEFDFVGPYTGLRYVNPDGIATNSSPDYRVPQFDQDHAAKWGLRLADIPSIGNWITQYSPDLVIIGLGVNDILGGQSAQNTATLFEQRVAAMRRAKPDIDIVISPPTQTWVTGVPEYNRLLTQIAVKLDTPPARIQLAPRPPGYTVGVHTYDDLHPNPSGEILIARSVAEGLVSLGVMTPLPIAAPQVRVTVNPNGTAAFSWTADPYSRLTEVFLRDRTQPSVWRQLPTAGSTASAAGLSWTTTYDVRAISSARGVRSPATTVPFSVPPVPASRGVRSNQTRFNVVSIGATSKPATIS